MISEILDVFGKAAFLSHKPANKTSLETAIEDAIRAAGLQQLKSCETCDTANNMLYSS